jgi:hypothetical protein
MSDLQTQFPTTPSFQSVNFKINTPTLTSETFSGKLRRVGQGVSYYSWEVQYPNLAPLDAGTVIGYVSQCLGPQFSFRIVLPEISFTKLTGQTANTPTVSTSSAIGSIQVTLTGCGANGKVLAAGDFFKFANHSKVYMCVSPVTANSGGVATLFFTSPSVSTIPQGTQVTITNVPFTAVLDEDVQEFDVGFGGITSMTLSMREVW